MLAGGNDHRHTPSTTVYGPPTGLRGPRLAFVNKCSTRLRERLTFVLVPEHTDMHELVSYHMLISHKRSNTQLVATFPVCPLFQVFELVSSEEKRTEHYDPTVPWVKLSK